MSSAVVTCVCETCVCDGFSRSGSELTDVCSPAAEKSDSFVCAHTLDRNTSTNTVPPLRDAAAAPTQVCVVETLNVVLEPLPV